MEKWIGKKANPHHEKAVEQIKNGIVVNVFVSIQEAARKGNFSATAICKVCKGKGNLHKGYKWRYKKWESKRGNPITGQFPAVQSKMISDGYKHIRKGRNARKSKIRPK